MKLYISLESLEKNEMKTKLEPREMRQNSIKFFFGQMRIRAYLGRIEMDDDAT